MTDQKLPIKGYPKKWACETLKDLIEGNLADEQHAGTTYSSYAAMAHNLGLDEVAETFRGMSAQEMQHKKNLEEIFEVLSQTCPNLTGE